MIYSCIHYRFYLSVEIGIPDIDSHSDTNTVIQRTIWKYGSQYDSESFGIVYCAVSEFIALSGGVVTEPRL